MGQRGICKIRVVAAKFYIYGVETWRKGVSQTVEWFYCTPTRSFVDVIMSQLMATMMELSRKSEFMGGHKASEELLADPNIEQLAQIEMSLQEKITILSRCNPKLIKTC